MTKLPSLAATFLFVTVASASALTEADLAPAALAGKTLTFTVATGAAPFGTSGTWSGSFGASPGNAFTKTPIIGDESNTAGTWAFNSVFSGLHEYTITNFISGQANGIITLWVSQGAGRYEVFLQGLFGNSQTGSFTLGAAAPVVPPVVPPVTPPAAPEISIQQPAGSDLTDGAAKKSFGTLKIGKVGKTRVFTITNTGTTDLTGLSIRKDGVRKSDFIVGALGASSLAPGASTTFKVSFKPSAKGTRKAAIHILSNDESEASFDIQLAGEGAAR